METTEAIKKLTSILDELLAQKELDYFDCINLIFSDTFDEWVLELVVIASYGRNDKDELFLEWVKTDRLELVNDSGDDVMIESQRKELVKWIDNYVYNELTK